MRPGVGVFLLPHWTILGLVRICPKAPSSPTKARPCFSSVKYLASHQTVAEMELQKQIASAKATFALKFVTFFRRCRATAQNYRWGKTLWPFISGKSRFKPHGKACGTLFWNKSNQPFIATSMYETCIKADSSIHGTGKLWNLCSTPSTNTWSEPNVWVEYGSTIFKC